MASTVISEPYRPRRTWWVEVRELAGWQLKIYAISATGADLRPGVVDAALEHARERIPDPKDSSGWGFVVLHQGTEAVWALFDLWFDDILQQQVFRADLERPTEFGPAPFLGTAACVWELEVVKHERDAWVRFVLEKPAAPEFKNYAAEALMISPSDKGLEGRSVKIGA